MNKNGLIRVASIPQIKGMLPTRKLSQMRPFFGHIIPTTTPIPKILSQWSSGHQDLHVNISLNPLRPIITIFTKPPPHHSLTQQAPYPKNHRPSLSLINTGGGLLFSKRRYTPLAVSAWFIIAPSSSSPKKSSHDHHGHAMLPIQNTLEHCQKTTPISKSMYQG